MSVKTLTVIFLLGKLQCKSGKRCCDIIQLVCVKRKDRQNITFFRAKMDAVLESNQKISGDISEIKNALIELTVELADLKKTIKKSQPTNSTNLFSSIEPTDSFIQFNREIENDPNKLEKYKSVLKSVFTNNQNEIRSGLSTYFGLVLRACFAKKLMNELSWNKYKGKIAVGISRVFQAIQISGLEVDGLSTEFDRINILRKEFNKYKDCSRPRKGVWFLFC